MRNLCLVESRRTDVPGSTYATAIDVDENVLYASSEEPDSDGSVEVSIYKTEKSSKPDLCSQFWSTSIPSPLDDGQVVSMKVLPENRQLVCILRGGDITTLSLDDEFPEADVQGTVEPGISSASWSPDDSLLALTTIRNKHILMTSTFDVLSESNLNPEEFGEDTPINVGWGSKQTQFHGSLGKQAAQASTAPSNVGSSPDDDGTPRISWRGDGAFYVVSSLSPSQTQDKTKRVLRVYNREGALQSTSEDTPGLEHPLSWRPSGNLIASTQRFGFEGGGAGKEGRHDVVFFERNGLRHGEFGIRVEDLLGSSKGKEKDGVENDKCKWGYRIKELLWSVDSDVLAVWIETNDVDIIQLWTTGNYHWYLKHEISAPKFTSILWHPESPLTLLLTTKSGILERKYSWDTSTSLSLPPNDTGTVAVVDGTKILLTPFRIQIVPPPMSSYELSLLPSQRVPVHAAFLHQHDTLVLLWEDGHIQTWNLKVNLKSRRGKAMSPEIVYTGTVADVDGVEWRQVSAISEGSAALLGSQAGHDVVAVVSFSSSVNGKTIEPDKLVKMPGLNGRLLTSEGAFVWQNSMGELFDDEPAETAKFSEFCFHTAKVSISGSQQSLFIGSTIGVQSKLYVASRSPSPSTDEPSSHKVVSSNANSWTVASGFLIFTTTAHEVHFAPLLSLLSSLASSSSDDLIRTQQQPNSGAAPVEVWEKRRVERGSRIVVPVPSAMALVLQMPRGNLETINPRPLIMEIVNLDLKQKNYRKAFSACRKHRIDLNALVDYNRATFLEDLDVFIEQVENVDDINLFLTNIGRGSSSPDQIGEVCDATRNALEKKDLVQYVNSILTAYVVKTPPDLEAGLSLLLRLRADHPTLVEDAVKYIIFLVDADKLFDVALGMYDFSLVLMIAQHSQKDPREYLPFLRELRAMSKYKQRFKVDDTLRRHASALNNLYLAGPESFEEALEYTERHQLYESALNIWKGTDNYAAVLNIYGDWFYERKDYRHSAALFVEANSLSKAMIAYEKALDWEDLFDLAIRHNNHSDEDLVAMAYRVSEDLSSKKRFSESARVLLDYAKDVREAVASLVSGNLFSEARRIITLNKMPNLLVEIVHPGSLESRSQIGEDIIEMREQLRKQVDRLRELRVRKKEQPDAFYGADNPALQNVDAMTDASMPFTAFTRYTAAPTTASRASKMSSKTKRKMERKIGSGRKGTVDEAEYLLKSLTKLVARFQITQGEARSLLPHLLQFTQEHREEGSLLQAELDMFESQIKEAIEDVWKPDSTEPIDSWASRMAEKEKPKNPLETVPKPSFSSEEWRMKHLP